MRAQGEVGSDAMDLLIRGGGREGGGGNGEPGIRYDGDRAVCGELAGIPCETVTEGGKQR